MTDNFKQFLLEFAELLEKYKVELEATESCSGWESYVDGIEISQASIWEDGELLQGSSTIKFGKTIDFDDLHHAAKNSK